MFTKPEKAHAVAKVLPAVAVAVTRFKKIRR